MHHHFIDQYSELNSLLHRIDPRVKIIMFTAIIFFVLLTPAGLLTPYIFYGAMILFLLVFSGIPFGYVFMRSLGVLPFVILTAVFFFLPLGFKNPAPFVFLLIKATLSILSMVLLVSTTRFADLLKAFEVMHCPPLFIMILSFLYRYIYLFLDEFMKMQQAKMARTVRKEENSWHRAKVFSSMIGYLFVRSYERGENVYLAMCSRGYQGRIKTLHAFVLGKRDYVFLALVFFYLIAVRIFYA